MVINYEVYCKFKAEERVVYIVPVESAKPVVNLKEFIEIHILEQVGEKPEIIAILK